MLLLVGFMLLRAPVTAVTSAARADAVAVSATLLTLMFLFLLLFI